MEGSATATLRYTRTLRFSREASPTRTMPTLHHFRFCPRSRAVRLVLAELGMACTLFEQWPWDWAPDLLALNPSGDLPVLMLDGPTQPDAGGQAAVLCGSYAITEYLAAEITVHPKGALPVPLFPGASPRQAEVRRLVDWFHAKLDREVTVPLLGATLLPLFEGAPQAAPDTDVLRAARANLAYHLSYVAWLTDQRNWLAGDDLSFADLAAAGHLSCLDYLGEIDWPRFPAAKVWYSRLKSRRCFQGILADRAPGRPPAAHYAELDF